MDTAAANAVARKGKLGQTIASILEDIKPECAYFGAEHGKRTGFIVVNLDGPHQIPAICEPFFLAFGAGIDMIPVMTPDDLGKAAPAIKRAAKKYGR
jgi:hypothetical protein